VNLEASVFVHLRAIHNEAIFTLHRDAHSRAWLQIHYRSTNAECRARHEREIYGEVVARVQQNGFCLTTIPRAGIIGGLVGGWCGILRACRRSVGWGRRIAIRFNQASEIGRWAHGYKITSRPKACDAVFA
jgi:hypothetical protein